MNPELPSRQLYFSETADLVSHIRVERMRQALLRNWDRAVFGLLFHICDTNSDSHSGGCAWIWCNGVRGIDIRNNSSPESFADEPC